MITVLKKANDNAGKKRNTCFYLAAGDQAHVYLRGASGRWCHVVTLEPGEFDPASVLNEEQARAHFDANRYEGDWLEM